MARRSLHERQPRHRRQRLPRPQTGSRPQVSDRGGDAASAAAPSPTSIGIERAGPAHTCLLDEFVASRPRQRARSFNHLIGTLGCFLDWAVTQQRLQVSPLRRTRRRETARRLPVPVRHRPGPSAAPGSRGASRQPAGHRPRADLPRHLRSLLRARAARRRGVRAAPRRCRRRPATARRAGWQVRQEPACPSRTAHRPAARRAGRTPRGPTGAAEPDAPLFSFDGRRSVHPRQREPDVPSTRRRSWTSRCPTASHRRIFIACVTRSPWGVCCGGIGRVSTRRRGCYQLSTFMGHVDPASTAVYLTITPQLLAEANRRFEAFAEPAWSQAQP